MASEAGELEDAPSEELLEVEELLTELAPSELEELLKELLPGDFEPESPPQAPTNNVGNKISNNFR